MSPQIKARDYEPDRIWSSMRREHIIRPADYPTRETFQSKLTDTLRRDRLLANLGSTGRRQLMERAFQDWDMVSPENRLDAIMTMRERGLLTKNEYLELAEEMGVKDKESEKQYRRWSGTEDAVWSMQSRGLLRRGEYGKLLRAKGLTYGQGWYRKRKWEAQHGIRSFRNFKPPERKKLVQP